MSKPSTSRHLLPPSSSAPNPIPSDNIDPSIFEYGDYDQPTKRRRLSEESRTPVQPTTTTSKTISQSRFQYSDDDFIISSSKRVSEVKTYKWNGEESDPIVFTSSAPQPSRKAGAVPQKSANNDDPFVAIDDSDDGLDDEHGGIRGDDDEYNIFEDKQLGNEDTDLLSDPFALPDPNELLSMAGTSRKRGKDDAVPETASTSFSSRTARLLESLDSRSKTETSHGRPRKRNAAASKTHDQDSLSDDLLPEPSQPKPKRATKLTAAEKEAKTREREAAKVQREREKQLEKERKQKLREEKAREKQLAADLS